MCMLVLLKLSVNDVNKKLQQQETYSIVQKQEKRERNNPMETNSLQLIFETY